MYGHRSRSLRILLVDDDQDTLLKYKILLIHDGHRVTTAGFDDAVALARLERFDLLMCGIGTPEHDGAELLAKLKASYPIRSIALTACGMPEALKRIAEAGFDEFLVTPVDLVRFRTLIGQMAVQIEFDRNRDERTPQPLSRFQSPWHIP